MPLAGSCVLAQGGSGPEFKRSSWQLPLGPRLAVPGCVYQATQQGPAFHPPTQLTCAAWAEEGEMPDTSPTPRQGVHVSLAVGRHHTHTHTRVVERDPRSL